MSAPRSSSELQQNSCAHFLQSGRKVRAPWRPNEGLFWLQWPCRRSRDPMNLAEGRDGSLRDIVPSGHRCEAVAAGVIAGDETRRRLGSVGDELVLGSMVAVTKGSDRGGPWSGRGW